MQVVRGRRTPGVDIQGSARCRGRIEPGPRSGQARGDDRPRLSPIASGQGQVGIRIQAGVCGIGRREVQEGELGRVEGTEGLPGEYQEFVGSWRRRWRGGEEGIVEIDDENMDCDMV